MSRSSGASGWYQDYLPEIATLDYGPDSSPEQVADALDARITSKSSLSVGLS